MSSSDRENETDRVRMAYGPLALEIILQADVIADRDRVRADPRLCAAPLVIVVPSRSLRLHLARKLVEWTGGACVGVEVLTLAGAARQIFFDASLDVPRGRLLLRTIVTQVLHHEPELEREIGAYDDAVGVLVATLRDLFDAGFDPAQADACREALDEERGPLSMRERDRAAAIVRLAARVIEHAERNGIAVGNDLPRRAALVLRAHPECWRARAMWIHGYSDATGSALDLLEQFARRPTTRIYHDALASDAFGTSLRARLGLRIRAAAAPAPLNSITITRAGSIDLEARAAADRVRSAIDSGVVPESIAIVARDLSPYRSALRRHLARLAIPFSSVGAVGADGPAERRVRAVAELLLRRHECPLEHWLAARDLHATQTTLAVHLELAGVRALGTQRLEAFAAIDLAQRLFGATTLRLPIRVVIEHDESSPEGQLEGSTESASEAEIEWRSESRRIPIAVLAEHVARGRATVARFAVGTARALARQHALEMRAFVEAVLGWNQATFGRDAFEVALARVVADVPEDLSLTALAFDELIAVELVDSIAPKLAGAGGGVIVLDVTEARGRSFGELHVLGLARGRFPRVVHDDALLADTLRARIACVLPDLGLKSVGRDEERVLFDGLVRSAPRVHLSWPTLDDADKTLLPSILLERVATPSAIEDAPLASDPTRADHPAVRTAAEHALSCGLLGGRAAFSELAAAVITEARASNGLSLDRGEIASARVRVLSEFEPDFSDRSRLGPYFGFVGEVRAKDDLRHLPLYVTRVETLAKCGWQAFLRHVLKLEPPLDPAADLPDVDARLVGEVVHAVLDAIHGNEEKRSVWPSAHELDALTTRCAQRALGERGILLVGFDALVAVRARPMLDIARSIDTSDRIEATLATEVSGSLAIPAGLRGARSLLFRADRSDRVDGGVRFTDYKTGSPIPGGRKDTTRHAHHLTAIANGTRLQAIVYALSAGSAGAGRYVFLKENVDLDSRLFQVRGSDLEARTVFERALATLLASYDGGAFLPRLLDAKAVNTNDACASCEVKVACSRGDSTANLRLALFVRGDGASDDQPSKIARGLWKLVDAKAPEPVAQETSEDKPKRKKKGADE